MRMYSLRSSAWLVVLALLTTSIVAQQGKARLGVERYLDWESVAGPQLSPDGNRIVYERRWIDSVNDRQVTSIWTMNSDGSRNRFLVDGSSPRWAPDGSRIAFLAQGEPQGSQVFVRWMDAEGATSQITRVTESPADIQWSPDGASIAFQMLVPAKGDPRWNIDMPGKPPGAKWTAPPRIVERLHYRQDRVGFLPAGFRHIFLVPANGGSPRQLTSGDWNHTSHRWMPNGRSMIFSSLRTPDAEWAWRQSDIYSVDVASGNVRQLTERSGPDQSPIPSPDGRYIAYQGHDHSTDTYIEAGLYVMNADGSNSRRIAGELGRSLGNVSWTADGGGLYFNASINGTQNLYRVPLNGDPDPVTEGNHMLQVTSIDRNGKAVGVLSTSRQPAALVALDLQRPNSLRSLHSTNRTHMAEVGLGEVEMIWYSSVDDFRIQGWIVKPPDFDPSRKYPMILRIHGGPHGMYNFGFDFKNHNHAANGYVVLYTNPRGSSGYGSRFGNAIKNAYPDKDFDDLMAGVDEVIARGYIDDRNLFVYGGSGGGVLTAWIVGHTNRFRAAVSKAPVINWMSFVGTTDGAGWYYNFEKLPWEDPTEHLQRSPLMYVGNVTTPTMLMTGQRDLRTPMPESEQFYRALKLRKIPTAMVRLTDGWHSRSSPPTNFIRVQLYLRNWFERHMIRDEPVPTGGGNQGQPQ